MFEHVWGGAKVPAQWGLMCLCSVEGAKAVGSLYREVPCGRGQGWRGNSPVTRNTLLKTLPSVAIRSPADWWYNTRHSLVQLLLFSFTQTVTSIVRFSWRTWFVFVFVQDKFKLWTFLTVSATVNMGRVLFAEIDLIWDACFFAEIDVYISCWVTRVKSERKATDPRVINNKNLLSC